MAVAALIAVGLLALLVFVLFGALLEMFRDVRQLRDAAGILDRPLAVDVAPVAGTIPSRYGLPQPLDAEAAALVLVISETCSTCRALAAGIDKPLPEGLWIVLESRNVDTAASFLEAHALMPLIGDGRVLVDADGAIARELGLDTTPVAFRVEQGRLTTATTVPSMRYLTSILPRPIRLTPRHSREWRHVWSTNTSS